MSKDDKERLFIKKIEISNCGRFFGAGHEIYLSDSPEKNITIIIGLSGRGKSTIHDLIYWCFYGQFKNNDQAQNKSIDYGLVNIDALNGLSRGQSTTASVTIWLHDNNGEKYVLTRKLTATFDKELTSRRFEALNNSRVPTGMNFEESVKMIYKDVSGKNELETNPHIIENEINKNFPQHLSDFFLFDGENLIKFRNQTSSEFIKNGITKISGLDILDYLIKNSEDTANTIYRCIGGKSTTSASYADKHQRLSDDIKEYRQSLKKNREEKKKIDLLYDEVLKKIGRNQKSEDTLKSQKSASESIEYAKKEQNKNKANFKEFLFDVMPQMMIRDTLKKAEAIFVRLENEDKIPPSIASNAIDKILQSNPLRCVCGREFEKNNNENEPWAILTNMKKTIVADDISQGILLGRNLMSQMINNTSKEKLREKLDNFIAIRRETGKQISVSKAEYDSCDRQLEEHQHNDSEDLLSQKTEYQQMRMNLENIIITQKYELEDLKDNSLKVEQKLENALSEEGKFKVEQNKIVLGKAISKFSKELEKRIEEILRTRTQDATNHYFLESAPEKATFDHVNIAENYDITVRDKKNLNAKLSKGQAHILGLSYVAGIREITNSKTFLIIDSPLHNISGDARNAISEAYSKYLPGVQIVLLVTDTEYLQGDADGAEPVKNILCKNNKIWKEYELEQINVDGIENRKITELTS